MISTGLPETGPAREPGPASAWTWCAERLGGARPPASARRRRRRALPDEAPSYPVLGVEGAEALGLRSTFTHRGYLDAVTRVRDYIIAGDIFQANLSQRFQAPLAEPPFELYARLRRRESGAVCRLSRPAARSR